MNEDEALVVFDKHKCDKGLICSLARHECEGELVVVDSQECDAAIMVRKDTSVSMKCSWLVSSDTSTIGIELARSVDRHESEDVLEVLTDGSKDVLEVLTDECENVPVLSNDTGTYGQVLLVLNRHGPIAVLMV